MLMSMHLGAVLDLLTGHLDRVAIGVLEDEPREPTRAGDVGALAHVDEERVRADVERLQAGEAGALLDRRARGAA